MTPGRRLGPALVAGALLMAACGGGHDGATTTTSSSTTTTAAPVITAASPTTPTTVPVHWAPVPKGDAKVVVTTNGIPLAVRRAAGEGTYVATSPCGNEVTVAGTPLTGANVVLDPGHGGDETGAVGFSGTTEKTVNLAVAQDAQRRLEALGAKVVLTRTGDYRVTLASRAAIAVALHPQLFLSIHHNADPDEERRAGTGPGSETYFQIKSPRSKRAAGLVYEEVVQAFSAYEIPWFGDTDAGAKYRLANDGGDYYGVLRRTAGIPAVLSEAAFLTNAPEEDLLRTPAFQEVEAEALTRAVVRFVTTADPGSGFVTPYPRTQPAGPGGGAAGCVDPPLG